MMYFNFHLLYFNRFINQNRLTMLNSSATRFASVLSIALLSLTARSQGVTTPRPSPAATATQTIGISSVSVNYSRPSIKGRQVWGGLVPYGLNAPGVGSGNPAPWRAGANENTILQLSDDAIIEGHPVRAGSYGLFFVVNKDNTAELVLSKDYHSWGNFWYDPAHDEMRAKIQLRPTAMTELLTYDFGNITKNSGELLLNWEKIQFPVKIEFATDNIVLAKAEEVLQGPTFFNPQPWTAAASYCLQNKVSPDKGLVWINQAIAIQKNFNTLSIKAGLLRQTSKADSADKLMEEAITLGNENDINTYGYTLLAAGQTDKAIDVLVVNTKRYPKDANCFDSLGEAYATKGDKKNAIINFKKSLSMNPTAATKANSEKFLAQLGAN
jgi:tetratricopeptide (TPR) repeat protein